MAGENTGGEKAERNEISERKWPIEKQQYEEKRRNENDTVTETEMAKWSRRRKRKKVVKAANLKRIWKRRKISGLEAKPAKKKNSERKAAINRNQWRK